MSKSTPNLTFQQQLEKAACEAQEPEPPQRPPPRRTEGLGARAALNSLRALSPVAQFVRWTSGKDSANLPPETPRGPTTSSSQPNLPSVAKPPATPAPRATGRRPSTGRRSRSCTATPREEHQESRAHSARGRSEAAETGCGESSLPSVRPQTPTAPEPSSARSASVRVSYQMTPREFEAPNPADGPTDSPAPRRPRSKGPSAEASNKSSTAAPSPVRSSPAMSSPGSNFNSSSNCREMLEVQGNAQKLLEAVFEITITEEAAISILDSYPELVWLANCLRRCPLPPGWTAMDAGQGKLRYVDMATGAASETSPLMPRFADLGRLMLHWRQNPAAEIDVAAALGAKRDQDTEEAARARKVWKGPHTDPKTGADFWHCPATGRSTWGDPGMAAEFLARIADRLQKALPASALAALEQQQQQQKGSSQPSKSATPVEEQETSSSAADHPGDESPQEAAASPPPRSSSRKPSATSGSISKPSPPSRAVISDEEEDSEDLGGTDYPEDEVIAACSSTAVLGATSQAARELARPSTPMVEDHKRPMTPLVDRRAEVRDMMVAMIGGDERTPGLMGGGGAAKAPAARKPSRSRPQGKRTPSSSPAPPTRETEPQPPNAPRGARGSASEPSLQEVAENLREDIRARRRSTSVTPRVARSPPPKRQSAEQENPEDPMPTSRIHPGTGLAAAELLAETYNTRPECRRRRQESLDRAIKNVQEQIFLDAWELQRNQRGFDYWRSFGSLQVGIPP
eukprot:TRINITY_DN8772_c0_g1_i3.p1 TRINITY_DN8772_c0_g1~~TRINITY_DN8772_c0_g1_i3.p1  ORF type:complete len:764 (+),score=193.38 TRINITY_DN8772_c0_g1_i3:62-2293(+)